MDSEAARSELTVSEVTRHVRELIEGAAGLARIWVRGEASNVRLAGSGHLYFTLKDSQAQLRIAYFRFGKKRKPPADGDALLVHGDVRVYEPRGEYQLIADDLIKAGVGDLAAQFEALKKKLHEEGLFAEERKVMPPRVPFSRSVSAVTTKVPAKLALVMNTLEPLSTQASPSLTAVVRVPPASEPAKASVSPKAPSVRPLARSGTQRARC